MSVPGSKTENRGGARPGAGRKRQTLSVRQVNAMLRKARERARVEGKDIDDILLDFIYGAPGAETSAQNRIACIKLWKSLTMAKPQEGGETDRTANGPAVYLPEQRPVVAAIPKPE